MNATLNKLLIETLEKMPKRFSSNQFNIVAKRKGVTKYEQDAYTRIFLFQNAHHDGGRMWTKEKAVIGDADLDYHIEIVKSYGYKVLKPTTEYKEV